MLYISLQHDGKENVKVLDIVINWLCTNIQLVVKPVWQPVWQPVVSCKRGISVTLYTVDRHRSHALYDNEIAVCPLCTVWRWQVIQRMFAARMVTYQLSL